MRAFMLISALVIATAIYPDFVVASGMYTLIGIGWIFDVFEFYERISK